MSQFTTKNAATDPAVWNQVIRFGGRPETSPVLDPGSFLPSPGPTNGATSGSRIRSFSSPSRLVSVSSRLRPGRDDVHRQPARGHGCGPADADVTGHRHRHRWPSEPPWDRHRHGWPSEPPWDRHRHRHRWPSEPPWDRHRHRWPSEPPWDRHRHRHRWPSEPPWDRHRHSTDGPVSRHETGTGTDGPVSRHGTSTGTDGP